MKQVITELIEPGDLQEKTPAPNQAVRRRLLARLVHALEGFWWCRDCDSPTERVEGEQGQPSHCARCGSHRISYEQPAAK